MQGWTSWEAKFNMEKLQNIVLVLSSSPVRWIPGLFCTIIVSYFKSVTNFKKKTVASSNWRTAFSRSFSTKLKNNLISFHDILSDYWKRIVCSAFSISWSVISLRIFFLCFSSLRCNENFMEVILKRTKESWTSTCKDIQKLSVNGFKDVWIRFLIIEFKINTFFGTYLQSSKATTMPVKHRINST